MGSLILGDRSRTTPADQPDIGLVVRDEPIRSPQSVTLAVGVTLVPKAGGATYTFTELPGGPASVNPAGSNVEMIYDPGVTTWGAMAGFIAGNAAAADLMEMQVAVLVAMPAGLVGGNLYVDLIGVPGSQFYFDKTDGVWKPWRGEIVGGAAMLAALVAIQANTAPDNRSGGVTHSLDNGGGPFVDHSLGIAGRTLSVDGLTGTASIRLVVGGVPYPTLPAPARDIFPLDRWFHDFTDVLLSCVSQPGQTISLYAGWRV